MASSNKTVATDEPVENYLNSVPDNRKDDIRWIHDTMESVSGMKAKMWGTAIVGFDQYHYKYESGREGDFFKIGFSSRKQNITIYFMPGFRKFEALMGKLGKYTTGKSCLYIKKLADVDRDILKTLIVESYTAMNEKYPKD